MIGILIIIGTISKTISQTGLIKDYNILNIFNWVDKTKDSPNYLQTIGFALAISAGIELGYMLFTDGPDEAVEPVILGIASVILIGISAPKPFKFNISGSIFLYVICITILFYIRHKHIVDNNKMTNESK